MKKTSDKIIEYISKNGRASGHELSDFLGITDRAVRKQLATLFRAGYLLKVGMSPRVFYILNKEVQKVSSHIILDSDTKKIIKKQFLFISPLGERTDGINGFIKLCQNRSFDIYKKAREYKDLYYKYQAIRKNNLISGRRKIFETFGKNICLEDVFYADFYAWEIFGKTKLGQLLLYGKQSQDKKIMKEISLQVRPYIQNIIERKRIDAVGFVPPTIKRSVQFMKILEKELNLSLPAIQIVKIRTHIITPQKTLNKLHDRIENATHTFVVTEKKQFLRILLIDDAVGSGATLNQIACKIKKAGIAQDVYGFAITGSIKGFDVISEV